jgi:phosphoserine aminotransferase
VASSEDRNFAYVPKNIQFTPDATYVHITSNNTIKGTQWPEFPNCGHVPLIADMSSDFLSRPFDAGPFGLIYAGAQKNICPAGTCMVIIRDDMLKQVPDNLPTMLKYTTHAEKNSMFNTPACFSVYVVQLVLKWLEETIGGLGKMAGINQQKSDLIYRFIDQSGFYRGTTDVDSRSQMNVTFRLPEEELEKKFVAEATKNDLGGLKGHRSVGGCRASIYNATSLKSVQTLVDFMKDFESRNG